jgi:hypothetical protein
VSVAYLQEWGTDCGISFNNFISTSKTARIGYCPLLMEGAAASGPMHSARAFTRAKASDDRHSAN